MAHLAVQRMEQRKRKNTDGTKQNTRRQENLISAFILFILQRGLGMEQRKCENADDTKQSSDGTKQIADGTKQIEDDTKQNKRRQSSWDPNSVGLGLGYFERVKLSHSCN
ncbi:hypothetical protein T07_4044 [Trichinella nelsoni]|uniref:Uncharacterized protein n=1 Tax=Trichinella nelsoni TaxID=6336 RepID=A0A0V0RLP9_9BILA|nr:hypothetical protein T07_4044 [Trichinella nelsoni]